MARAYLGGGVADWVFGVFEIAGRQLVDLEPATLTLWSAKTGGTQYTDLLLDGVAVTSIPVGEDGQVPQFEGPDGVTSVWADAGGARVLMTNMESLVAQALNVGSVLAVDNGDGTVTLTVAGGSAWTVTDNGDGTANVSLAGQTAVLGQTGLDAGDIPDLSATYTKVTEAPLNVMRYGAVGDSVANDLAAIQDALNALPTNGGTVFFPRPSAFYKTSGVGLDIPSDTTMIGESGTGTLVSTVSGPLFKLTDLRRELVFRGMGFASSIGGGHIFDLGATGALALVSFEDCKFTTYSNSASVIYENGVGDYIRVQFNNCDFTRFATSTAPGFDLRNTGGGLNGNQWENCRVTSNNATGGGAYFKLDGDLASTYTYDNRWKAIVGQLNPGGLIDIYSPFGATFEDINDYDVAGSYTQSLIRVGKSAGGYPTGIRASNVGNRGGTMNGTTVFQLEITAPMNTPAIIDRVWDASRVQKIRSQAGAAFTILDASGASAVLTQSTISKTLDAPSEGIVVFNGSNLTCTLPDPTAQQPGRRFVVKNVHSTALTVTSGVTIDGVGSKSLAQWATGTYVSDGVRYLSL